MKNQTKYIILLSLVSLMLLYYIGLVRYFIVHVDKFDDYVKNYNKLKKADENCKVIISFTTTPDRISQLQPMLISLLDQTVKVDQIALNLPYTHKGQKYTIPEDYKKLLNVFKVGKDYGPGTKLLPTLLREGEVGTKIIYIDDDYIYGKDFIETIVNESIKNPTTAIHTKNRKFALVKPEFFNKDVINHEMDYFDDEWIINHITSQKQQFTYNQNYKTW
jgi:hypothetical protein